MCLYQIRIGKHWITMIITTVMIRYTRWWAGKLKNGSKPVIDQFRPKHSRSCLL